MVWVNKTAMIGYTWLFVYESLCSYQGRMNAGDAGLLGSQTHVTHLRSYKGVPQARWDPLKTLPSLLDTTSRLIRLGIHVSNNVISVGLMVIAICTNT